jgi:NDP-sugar pyrophosphorylase family protein
MMILIPMAGAGSRFSEAGYEVPKPLLPILGKPMVVSAADALPKGHQYTFIVRDFQIVQYQVDKHLKTYFPECNIVILDHLTEGQAVTCLHAKELIDNEHELAIGASDNGMIYSVDAFNQAKIDTDALVFSFRNNPSVIEKPEAYGWIRTKEENVVESMSVKVPISATPMNDHAVVGAFWFRKGSMFVEAAERMISLNRRINNEFYVDECINDLIELGYKVKVFEIDHYVCWGTPNDYKTFNYWESYYEKMTLKGNKI